MIQNENIAVKILERTSHFHNSTRPLTHCLCHFRSVEAYFAYRWNWRTVTVRKNAAFGSCQAHGLNRYRGMTPVSPP